LNSLIGLAFIGKAFAAVSLPNCSSFTEFKSECSGSTPGETYCIHTDKKIYPVTDVGAGTCSQALGAGLYVFKVPVDKCERLASSPSDWNTSCESYFNDADCAVPVDKTPGCESVTFGDKPRYKKVESKGFEQVSQETLKTSIANYKERIVLYNCDALQCVQTSGFIRDNAANYVVSVNGVATPTAGGGNEVTLSCTAGQIKTDSDNKLCIKTSAVEAGTGKEYIMENVEGNLFGTYTAETASIKIPIKTASKIYAWDNLANVKFVKKSDSAVVTSIDSAHDAIAANPKNYEIYDCKDGFCQITYGYIKSKTDVFAYVNGEDGEAATSAVFAGATAISNANACSMSNIGQVLTNAGGICINQNKVVTFDEPDPLAYDEHIILNTSPAVEGTPFYDSDYVVPIKRGDNYILKDIYFNEVVLVKKEDSKIEDYTGINVGLSGSGGDPSKYIVVDCVNGKCIQTEGYIYNNNAVFAFGKNGGEKTVNKEKFVGKTAIAAAENCVNAETEGATVGMIYNKNGGPESGICIGTKTGIAFNAAFSKHLLLKEAAVEGTPFYDSTNSVPIKNYAGYIVRDYFYEDGVNLVKTADGTVLTNLSTDIDVVADNYVLVDCVEGVCKQTQGYIKDSAKVIAFIGEGISAVGVNVREDADKTAQFNPFATLTAKSACAATYIGKVYAEAGSGICIDATETHGVDFVTDGNIIKKYIIDSSSAATGTIGTPFESEANNLAIKSGLRYIIRDEFNTSIKLIKTEDMSLWNIGVDLKTEDAYQDYKIVECIEGVCEFTEGYIKSNDYVYKFNNNAAGALTTSNGAVGVTKESGCTEDHVGTIFTYDTDKKAICIGHGKSVNFEDSGNYMVVNDIVEGTPFENPDYSISIKSGENYIIKEKFNSSVNLVKSSNGFSIADLKTANGDLTLNPSDYIIFDCLKGNCVQTVGYVVNDSKVFSFVGTNGGVEVTSSGVSSCSAGAIGKLLSSHNKICISSSKDIELKNTNINMIIQGKAASGTPFESNEESVQIKSSENYVVKDNFVGNGVYLVNVNDGTIKTEIDIAGPIANLANNYLIVECKENVCIQTPGYIRNNGEVYSFTGSNAGTKVTSTVAVASCDKVGNVLSTKDGICYSVDQPIGFNANGANYIILKGLAVSNTPFDDSKTNVPIKRGANYIIKDNFYPDGVNLVKKSDGTVLTRFSDKITIENGYILVDCVDRVCKQTQGYIKDSEKVIAFVGDAVGVAGSDSKFVGEELISASNECTSDYIGMLYNNVDGVCVYNGSTKRIGVDFSVEDEILITRHILDSGVADTPFASGSGKIAIKRGTRYIIRDEFYNSGDYCTYAVTTEKMKVKKTKFCSNEPEISGRYYKCTDGQCSVVAKEDKFNNVENGIYMFKVDGTLYDNKVFKCKNGECKLFKENGIYVFQNQDEEDKDYMTRVDDIALNALTGISKNPLELYHCFDGYCISTSGLVRYGSGPSVASCAVENQCTLSEFVKCNTDEDDEKVRSNMDLCVDQLNKFEPFIGVGVFYENEPDSYKLYKRTGVNVVGVSKRSGNYYSVLDENLYVCTGDSCVIGNEGYTLNSDTDTKDEYPLIYCSGAGIKCSIKSKAELANGFYLNSGSGTGKYVICDNDTDHYKKLCKEVAKTTIEKSNCSDDGGDHKYGMIYAEGFKFCKGDGSGDGVAVPQDDSFKYYLIKDSFEPGKHFNYPSDIEGPLERNVLFKIEKYSITALTGSDIPIGYLVNSDGPGYIECKFNSDSGGRECNIASIVDADDADAVTNKECLNVGGLYKKGSKNRICLDTVDKINVDLTTDIGDDGIDSAGAYVMPLNEGLFGISKGEGNEYYIVINVDGNGNVTVVKELESIKYRYTVTDADTHKKTLYKIYDKGDAEAATGVDEICDAREGKAKPFEFKLIEWTVGSGAKSNVDYYVKGVNDDLNDS